jgi:hypothetical protein
MAVTRAAAACAAAECGVSAGHGGGGGAAGGGGSAVRCDGAVVAEIDDHLAVAGADASRLQLLGDKIYQLVVGKEIDNAGRLTGMLLELSWAECESLVCADANVVLMVHLCTRR